MSDQLHKETQLQAEAMLKIAEVLGEKIDRLSIRVDEGVGNDIQIVVDRMSDAIRAMSTVNGGRARSAQASRTRASPFFTGHSVPPFRSTVTQVSSTAIAGRSSMLRTRPPATIVSPMNTGARNWAEMASTASGSPAHATTPQPCGPW